MSNSTGHVDVDHSSKESRNHRPKHALKHLLEDLRLLGAFFTSTHTVGTLGRESETSGVAGGVYACGHSSSAEGPELHASGIGKIPTPLAQDVTDQLQQLCHHTDLSPAEDVGGKAWQLSASMSAATNPCRTVAMIAFIKLDAFISDCDSHSWTQTGRVQFAAWASTSARSLVCLLQQALRFCCTRSQLWHLWFWLTGRGTARHVCHPDSDVMPPEHGVFCYKA